MEQKKVVGFKKCNPIRNSFSHEGIENHNNFQRQSVWSQDNLIFSLSSCHQFHHTLAIDTLYLALHEHLAQQFLQGCTFSGKLSKHKQWICCKFWLWWWHLWISGQNEHWHPIPWVLLDPRQNELQVWNSLWVTYVASCTRFPLVSSLMHFWDSPYLHWLTDYYYIGYGFDIKIAILDKILPCSMCILRFLSMTALMKWFLLLSLSMILTKSTMTAFVVTPALSCRRQVVPRIGTRGQPLLAQKKEQQLSRASSMSKPNTASTNKMTAQRRKQLGIADDEDEYDLERALQNNTDPFITKLIAGSFILVVLGLLIVGVIMPSLTDYGDGVCSPIQNAGRCWLSSMSFPR